MAGARVQSYGQRLAEARLLTGPVLDRPVLAASRQGRDLPPEDFADGVVDGIDPVDGAIQPVDSVPGGLELALRGRAIGISGLPGHSGQGGDVAMGVHLPQDMVPAIGDHRPPGSSVRPLWADRDAAEGSEARLGRRPVFISLSGLGIAQPGLHRAIGGHEPDPVADGIQYQPLARHSGVGMGAGEGQPVEVAEPRRRPRARP